MKTTFILPMLSLQLFAEGGAPSGDGAAAQGQGVTAEAASQQKGDKNPLANVKYGIQENAPAAGVQTTEAGTNAGQQADPEAEFEALIKGKFKQQYDSRVQNTIQQRLKGSKETAEKYSALQPVLEILGSKYGVDASDAKALAKAIEADDGFFEEEAMKQGMTVKQFKEWRSVQQENAELRRQMNERKAQESADQQYAAWMNQAESAKQFYPSFNLKTELSNPRFLELLNSNIDVKTAYEVIHKDELIPAAMQYAAKATETRISRQIAANGARPAENGMNSGSAAVVKNDVTKLTAKDIDEIARRVARGEKVTFG